MALAQVQSSTNENTGQTAPSNASSANAALRVHEQFFTNGHRKETLADE